MTSRQQAGRSLTLTEELERLEQSITLTLQEIDHNFSRAHRIVTTSILPIVEEYATHSRDVWEGAKFWKQFFEASANVSLSGYEEQQSMNEAEEQTVTDHSNTQTESSLEASESYDTPSARHVLEDSLQDVDLSNLTISPSHSTPRPTKQARGKAKSPYNALQRENEETVDIDDTYTSRRDDPQTPSKQTSSLLDDVAMTPEHSPEPETGNKNRAQHEPRQKRSDPILHTVLDKRYRIQATPLAGGRTTRKDARTPATAARNKPAARSALESSPLAPPELHAEVFDSPMRRELTQTLKQQRTPGVSVLTPGRRQPVATNNLNVWDSDEEDDLIDEATGMPYGASPPKTMQFHVPQSRLMKTPAREASKQIVDNILASAGIHRNPQGEEFSEDIEIDLDLDYEDENNDMDQNSPSIVRKAVRLEDETF